MRTLKAVVLILSAGGAACWGQNNAAAAPAQQVDRASAYYHYTLAQMYLNLALSTTNRGDYLNQAIDNLKLAVKDDPKTPVLAEELADLYIQTGRSRDAQDYANGVLGQNPDDLAAHRVLGRVYTTQLNDARNRLDESMLRRAIDEYKKITDLDPTDVDSWVLLGRLQRVAMNPDDAESAFRKALAAAPDSADALTGLADILLDKNDSAGALDLLKKAADKNPSAISLQRLATAYEQLNQYSLAADTLQKAVDLNPDNAADLERALAQDLTRAGRYQEALGVYQDLAMDDPMDAEAFLRMSQIYIQLHDYPKAREAGDKARTLEPNNIEVQYNEVNILQAEGKSAEAIQRLQGLLISTEKQSYDPRELSVRSNLLTRLALMQRLADKPDDAVATYRQLAALDSSNGPAVSGDIIDTYVGDKEFDKAQQEADAAIKKWPDDRGVRLSRDSLLAEMGKIDAAASDAKKLLNGSDDDREVNLALAEIYQKGKQYDETGKYLDAAEKLSPTSDEKIDVWFRRGAMYERMKNVAAAETEFRRILGGAPDNAATLNYLGYMLADRSVRLPEALEMIKKAVDQEPNNGAYLDSLGWVYFKMGRIADAEEYMRKAVDATPHDPTMRDHYAQVLLKASKVREAVAQWEISLKEWGTSSPTEMDQAEIAKVKQQLESARVSLAKENGGRQ
jgi:tetratricopeptide (TPR) repeat protein